MAVAALCAAAHPAMAGQALSTTTKHSPIAKGDSYWWNSVTGETSLTDPSFVLKGHSDEQGNVYYIDPQMNESVWEKPEEYAWEEVESEEHKGRQYFHNTKTNHVTWDRPSVLGWQSSEIGFWYNSVTGVSQMEPPEALGHRDVEHNRTYWIDPESLEPVWEPPAAYAWVAHQSDDAEHDGREYYHNSVTGETLWEKPEPLGWARKSRTKTFWFNQITGETTRTRPAAMGVYDEDTGTVYYNKNNKADESTWEPPEDAHAAWSVHQSDEHDNRTFYVNQVTGEKVWDKPAALGWVTYHEDL